MTSAIHLGTTSMHSRNYTSDVAYAADNLAPPCPTMILGKPLVGYLAIDFVRTVSIEAFSKPDVSRSARREA